MAKSATQRQTKSKTEANGGLVLVPGRRQLLGDQLYGQILDQIISGRLTEGDRLPPEKDICAMFGVSRPVVRDALARLRADGLLKARQGSGTYVLRRPSDRITDFANTADLARFLRCAEARAPLEAAAARLAAERRTSMQLARIEAAHEAFGAEARSGRLTAEGDIAFHAAIAEATGNEFFTGMLRQIHDTIAGFMTVSMSMANTASPERMNEAFNEHVYIVDAIRAQEPESADVAMRFHIGQSRHRVIDHSRNG